jgi:hypothetical protein
MKCFVKDGKEAVNINNVDRYCYEHYQVYDSLQKIYQQLSNSNRPISWQEYLTKVLDTNFTVPWKISLIGENNGMILHSLASVASVELKQ